MKKKLAKRMLIVLLLTGCLLCAACLLVNHLVVSQNREYIYPSGTSYDSLSLSDADCILVLGAGVREDGTPSHMLEDRILTGITLYEESGTKLLMSGDHGRADYNEVGCMKDYAIDRGVPSEDIFMDHAGFSTYDSLYRARDVFGAKKVIIVSQTYHLYRAVAIARSLGLEAVGVSADLRSYMGQPIREVREIAARVKDMAMTVFQPEPKYLGEPVSLTGSGDVTND
ncbi:MAG: YdcF family protein [Clostridia bacterium]|nr:YdcF family protein [Clostridia bacterium]